MMNSIDDPNVDAQLSPISGAFDNMYSSNVVFRTYGIHYSTPTQDPRVLSPDP